MKPRLRTTLTLLAATAVVWAACSKDKKEKMDHVVQGEFVEPQDSLPLIRYFDTGLVSLNDRCAVRKTRLSPRMPPVYVNGQPIGFC
jgi:hypothetical protein